MDDDPAGSLDALVGNLEAGGIQRVIVAVIFPGNIDRDVVTSEADRVASNEGCIQLNPWSVEELPAGEDHVDLVIARSVGFCGREVRDPVVIDWAKVKDGPYGIG